MGIKLNCLHDIGDEKTLRSMLDKILEIQIKNKASSTTGRTYMNIYLNRLVGKVGKADNFNEVDMAQTPWGK